MPISAERPTSQDGRQYHLGTGPRDLAPDCLLVGRPRRARMIAETFLTDAKRVGDDDALLCFTGKYHGHPMSIVTCGMGGPSVGTVLPDAVASGARVFIKVGSCGALQYGPIPGDLIVSTGALRFDGASDCWAEPSQPALADPRIVKFILGSAARLGLRHHVGNGATTSCFYEGQGRPSAYAELPGWMRERHEMVMRAGTMYYSM